MHCLFGCLAMLAPRLVLLGIWLFSTYLERAFDGKLWLFLGFLFMPLTTLAYAWAINSGGSVEGFRLVIVLIAVLVDLGLVGGSGRAARRRRREREREESK